MSNYRLSDVVYLPINRSREFYPFAFLSEKVNKWITIIFASLLFLLVFSRYLPDILVFVAEIIEVNVVLQYPDTKLINLLGLTLLLDLLIWFLMIIAVIYFSFISNPNIEFYKLSPFLFWAIISLSEIIAGNIISGFPDATKDSKRQLLFIFSNIVKTISVFLFFILSWKYWKNVFWKFLEKPHNIFLFIIVLCFFYFYVSSHFDEINSKKESGTNQDNLEKLYANGDSTFKIFFIIVIVVLGVLFEEIVFRFAIFQIFGRRNALFAIIISSLFFATLHHNSLLADKFINNETAYNVNDIGKHYKLLLPYFFIGLLFANYYVFNDYVLIYSIVAHSIHNGFVLTKIQ